MASIKDAAKYLSLSEAIQTLKAELLKADSIAKAENNALLAFEECEIELLLEFEPSIEAGFDIHVFKAKAGAKAKGSHKLKVKYKAIRDIVAVLGPADVKPPRNIGKPRSTKAAPPRR